MYSMRELNRSFFLPPIIFCSLYEEAEYKPGHVKSQEP